MGALGCGVRSRVLLQPAASAFTFTGLRGLEKQSRAASCKKDIVCIKRGSRRSWKRSVGYSDCGGEASFRFGELGE